MSGESSAVLPGIVGLSERIVDVILDTVERVAHFEGRRPHRTLVLPLIVSRDSDERADVRDRLIAYVEREIRNAAPIFDFTPRQGDKT